MNADYGRPSTWVRFKPSLCEGCAGDCCRLPVEADAADLLRLGLLSEDEAASPSAVRHAARRLEKEGVVQSFRAKTGLFTLAQRTDERCIFLSREGRCTVYERRPETCRRFPAVIGPRVGFCPARKAGDDE